MLSKRVLSSLLMSVFLHCGTAQAHTSAVTAVVVPSLARRLSSSLSERKPIVQSKQGVPSIQRRSSSSPLALPEGPPQIFSRESSGSLSWHRSSSSNGSPRSVSGSTPFSFRSTSSTDLDSLRSKSSIGLDATPISATKDSGSQAEATRLRYARSPQGRGKLPANDFDAFHQEPSLFHHEGPLPPLVIESRTISEAEAARAIRGYTMPKMSGEEINSNGISHDTINRELRDAEPSSLALDVAAQVQAGLKHMPRHDYEKDGPLTRLEKLSKGTIDELYTSQKGAIITNRGFTSTSIHSHMDGKVNVKIAILAPTSGPSSGRRVDHVSYVPKEGEVLFPPGQQFEVIGVETHQESAYLGFGKREVHYVTLREVSRPEIP